MKSIFLPCALALWTALSVRGAAPNDAVDILRQTGAAFAAVAEKAIPAVVFIKAERTVAVGQPGQQYFYNDPFGLFGDDFLERFFGGPQDPNSQPRSFRQMGQGSGFIVTEDGYILTNHHVVGDADKITVKLHDGREFEAERVGTDPKSEVAVIRIPGRNLPFVALGDSEALRVGEWAVAVGNPFGLAATVTAGIISAKGRSGIGITDYENFIQTDAAINPGNSGGPLLNIAGQVIGINTAIYSRSGGYMGIGFAIPVNMARAIKTQLIQSGKVTRGFLGVVIQELTPELAQSFGVTNRAGVLVSDTAADSPAGRAGIKPGDIILRLNGREVTSIGDFRNDVAANPPGTRLKLTLSRDGREREAVVAIGALPDEAGAAPGAPDLVNRLGLGVQDLTPETARQHGYDLKSGALVVAVAPDSPAAQAGIRPGNLITAVNRQPVAGAKDFTRAVERSGRDGVVLLRVRDGEYARFVTLRPVRPGS